MKAKIEVGKISRVCSLMFRFFQQKRAESPMEHISAFALSGRHRCALYTQGAALGYVLHWAFSPSLLQKTEHKTTPYKISVSKKAHLGRPDTFCREFCRETLR